jgi:hypothetical protein
VGISDLRRWVLRFGLLCLVAALALFVYASRAHGHDARRILLFLSALGLGIGSFLTAVFISFLNRWWRGAIFGLLAVIVSQASYHLLVWSGWKTQSLPWRVWWISMVASLVMALLLVLRAAHRMPQDPVNILGRASTAIAAFTVSSLALRRDLLGELPALVLITVWAPVALGLGATLVIIVRSRPWPTLGPRGRIMALIASHLAMLGLGLYVGHRGAIETASPAPLPSSLATLSPSEVDAQLESDLSRLQAVCSGLKELEQRMAEYRETLRTRLAREARAYLRPEEDDRLRWSFVTYLSYRTALLRLVTTFAGYEAVHDPQQRARCFMLGYAAAATVYRSGLDFVDAYAEHPIERRKLNEAEPAWGIPAGMFDRVLQSVSADRHVQLCEEMAAYYEHQRDAWREQGIWPEQDFTWLDTLIHTSIESVRARGIERHRRWLELFMERVRQDTYTPLYAVQSTVAEWIGDIRIVDRPRCINYATVRSIQRRLKPGDILLERRSWNASNAFLPGFWPHAALYIGTTSHVSASPMRPRWSPAASCSLGPTTGGTRSPSSRLSPKG